MAHFYLKKPRKDGTSSILLAVTVKSVRLLYNTEITCRKSEWDAKNQKVKTKARASEINPKLLQLALLAKRYEDELPLDEQPQQGRFTLFMDVSLGRRKEAKQTFFGFLDDFCATSGQRINKNTGAFITANSANRFRNTVNILRKFEAYRRAEDRCFQLSFDSFTPPTIESLKLYMTKMLEFSPSTIGKHFKNIRLMLKSAEQKSLKTNADFTLFHIREEKTENIILTEDEIGRIHDLDLSDDLRLENCKNMFLIQLHTGLRFSDVCMLNSDNVNLDSGTISIHMQKTSEALTVPIHPRIRDIFEKQQFCHPISNAKYNQYLKEIGRLAGIDTVVEIKRVKAGRRMLLREPKWNFITSHTARRTFCSLLFQKGVDSQLIRAFSGHKTETAFQRYICLTVEQKSEMLKRMW